MSWLRARADATRLWVVRKLPSGRRMWLIYVRRFGPIAAILLSFLLRQVSRLWQNPVFWVGALLVAALWGLLAVLAHRLAVSFVAEAPDRPADTKRVPPSQWHQARLDRTAGAYAASVDRHVPLGSGHGGAAADGAPVGGGGRYGPHPPSRTPPGGPLSP